MTVAELAKTCDGDQRCFVFFTGGLLTTREKAAQRNAWIVQNKNERMRTAMIEKELNQEELNEEEMNEGQLWDYIMYDLFPEAKNEEDIAEELDDFDNDQSGLPWTDAKMARDHKKRG